jgi:hypothetical protein
VSTALVISCSPDLTTPAINTCHGFSVIAGVFDTDDKFINLAAVLVIVMICDHVTCDIVTTEVGG